MLCECMHTCTDKHFLSVIIVKYLLVTKEACVCVCEWVYSYTIERIITTRVKYCHKGRNLERWRVKAFFSMKGLGMKYPVVLYIYMHLMYSFFFYWERKLSLSYIVNTHIIYVCLQLASLLNCPWRLS